MAHTRINMRKSQADDLAAVCSLGVETLTKVADAVRSAPRTINQSKLRAVIREAVGSGKSEPLCRLVFGLSNLGSRDASKLADVIDGLTDAIERSHSSEERFDAWPDISVSLLDILECESVYLAAKALDLSYDFERVLTSCRVLTSVRPVYTDDRDTIVGATVVQTLRIEYLSNASERNDLSVSVDISDIENLAKVCTDALKKAEVVKKQLSDTWHSEIIMPGSDPEVLS